ncbi:hypothetical protein CEXT_156821 [Caerostris extrusa]|uniref:Uncharacterized protein n=1 Tax=Caerostris extrusa TaxID=172846 RepID=A0AAV4PAV6_CAEEX|nr:hypothetical protein CEXT_156821 [Caerostris extrusa]
MLESLNLLECRISIFTEIFFSSKFTNAEYDMVFSEGCVIFANIKYLTNKFHRVFHLTGQTNNSTKSPVNRQIGTNLTPLLLERLSQRGIEFEIISACGTQCSAPIPNR